MSLSTSAGTVQILTRISEIMGQVCNAIPVNIIILPSILEPHHWSLCIFVRKKTESLFPMALFTAVKNSLSPEIFFYFIIKSPASQFKLFKHITLPQPNANRA